MTRKLLSINIMQTLFLHYLSVQYSDELKKFVSSDFIDLFVKGINVFLQSGNDNILYYLAKDPLKQMTQMTGCHLDL